MAEHQDDLKPSDSRAGRCNESVIGSSLQPLPRDPVGEAMWKCRSPVVSRVLREAPVTIAPMPGAFTESMDVTE